MAQESMAAQASESDQDRVEEIVVTGSRIARRELTTQTPITVIGAPEYALSGTTNVEELLNTMPQVLPGEGGFTNNEGTGVATVDLRGLGIQRSLVLVNGRRWIFFDARQVTDLNTLPAALIAGTEIVTGGSSAVYGSDAVGGVVNFILKDDFEGLEISSQYDLSDKNGGDGYVANFDLTLGGNFADDRGNAVVYANYLRRESVLAADRPQSVDFLVDGVDANGNPTLVPGGSTSHVNTRVFGFPLSGPPLDARPAVEQALIDAGLAGASNFGFKFDDAGDSVSPYINPDDNYNFNPLNYLQLPQNRKMVGALVNFDVTDNVEAYTELAFVQNIVETKRAPTIGGGQHLIQVDSPFLPSQVQDLFAALDASEGDIELDANGDPVIGPDGRPVIIPAATANDGYTTVSVSRRLQEMGTRDVVFERNSLRGVFGARADLGDLGFLNDASIDGYYSWARTRNVQNGTGNALGAAYEQGLTTAFDGEGNLVCQNPANNCVPINIFGQNISEDAVRFLATSSTSSEMATMEVAAAVLTANTFELPGGPVGIAFGAEWRDMEGFFFPSQGSVGDIDAAEPTGGSYSVKEVFGELLVPIHERIDFSGAFRISDYTLAGIDTSTTWGAGLTWSPTDTLMLRGNFQRAVRAPSIDELFVGASGTAPAATDPCAQPSAATDPVVRDLCIANGVPPFLVGDPAVQPSFQIGQVTGGNVNLEEEEADTYTVGFVLTPENLISGLTATVDYYNIDVTGAIARLGGTVNNVLDLCFNQIQDINSPFCQAVVRQPSGVIGGEEGGVFILNTNVGRLETDGLDLNVNYGFDVGFGLFEDASSFDIAFGATWINSYAETLVAELPDRVNECAGSFGLTCEEPKPEYKATTRINWNDGPFTASLRWRWLDGTTDDKITLGGTDPADLPVPHIPSVSYVDLTTRYAPGDTYSVSFGIQNIADKKQPIVGSSQEQLNTFPETYDPFGRNFFLNFTYRLL